MKIVTIHGIRTRTSPFTFLEESPTLMNRGVQIEHFEYGFMSIPAFANPFSRKNVLEDFFKFYDEKVGFNERPSAVCHSFGTWILTEAIRTYPSIRFEKVILFGSILSPELDLDVFFKRDQVRELRHEVGRRDWVVPLSRLVLGKNGGKSGKVGFSDKRRKNRARLNEQFYDRFSHSSSAFLKHHIEEVWAPFLLQQPFKVQQRILGNDVLSWMLLPPAPNQLSFPRRTYHCRIDRLGNYFARYGA